MFQRVVSQFRASVSIKGAVYADAAGGTAVRIPAAHITPNTPSKLQFVLPQSISAGEWRIAVATQATGASSVLTKDVRRFEYPQIIRVE